MTRGESQKMEECILCQENLNDSSATRLASRMIMYSEAIDNMKAGIERPHSNNFTGAYYGYVP